MNTIRVSQDDKGVTVKFGPHYYVKIESHDSGLVTFKLGATHHGITADASYVDGELERVINKMRECFPELKHD